MIKRLIYSLFFHAIFLLLILGSFFSKDFDENELKEVAIDIAAISGNSEASIGNKNKGKIPDKKTLIKNNQKTESKKDSKKSEQQNEVTKNNDSEEKPEELVEKKTEESSSAKTKEPEEKISDNSDKPKVEDNQKSAEKKPEEKLEEIAKTEKNQQSSPSSQTAENSDEKSQEGGASNENISDIASLNLSAREKFNIQSQLRLCYNRASEEIGADGKIKITFKAKISLDGYITTNIDSIIDNQRYNSSDVDYKTSIDLAQRAVEICSPIRNLPIDKYEIWKEVILEFGGLK